MQSIDHLNLQIQSTSVLIQRMFIFLDHFGLTKIAQILET